jgi:hypothetical protein
MNNASAEALITGTRGMIHKGTKSPLSELYIDPVIVIMSGS